MGCNCTQNSAFKVQESERWTGSLEVNDTLHQMVWGPFADEEEATIQILKLEHLADLDRIAGNVEDLERIIWEEITIESDSGAKIKKMGDNLQALVDSLRACLKREQQKRAA